MDFARRATALAEHLGGSGDIRLVRAPGRVNLIGDHTDYCEGFVLPMAIDRDCLLAWRQSDGDCITAESLDLPGVFQVPIHGQTTGDSGWAKFVAGVTHALDDAGARVPPIDVVVSSTVPAGSGLSSSSALSVALTLACADAAAVDLAPRDAARIALDAEVRATGVPGGLMDQLAALLGRADHVLLIDCRSLDVEPVPMPEELAVVVVHSGLPRALAGSAYAERRAACEAAAAQLRLPALRDATLDQVRGDPIARHVVTENARVLATVDALRAGHLDRLGPLLLESHASLRDDFRVSTPELDLLVALLTEHGANGARLTGAGFGGCVIALSTPHAAPTLIDAVTSAYRSATDLDAVAFVVAAAGGADRPSLSLP